MDTPVVRPEDLASPESSARVLTALQKSNGKSLCAACSALAGGVSLMEARRALVDLPSSGKASVTVNGVCGVCGRRQDVMTRL